MGRTADLPRPAAAKPIPVETQVPYERTDSALDKIGKAHVRGVMYVIDALRTTDFWAFSRVGAVVVLPVN
jgi:hypothetical protein